VSFDWSTPDHEQPESIQWAAFYSDCEHEVLEVISGHRVTLTYNLFVSRGTGLLAGRCPAMDPKQLPLYNAFKEVLEHPEFMTQGKLYTVSTKCCSNVLVVGGLLGVGCAHAYTHTHRETIRYLPSSLKGVDVAVYMALRALGLHVYLRPVISKPEWEREWEDNDDQDDEEIVGTELQPLARSEFDQNDLLQILGYGNWNYEHAHVHWLREPRLQFDEEALIHLTVSCNLPVQNIAEGIDIGLWYGNEAGLDVIYSQLALLVKIMPFSDGDTERST